MAVMGSSSPRPLVLVGHPRSRSSAFERVFIQNEAHVTTLHEPFGDAYWLGPERQLGRYDALRDASGFSGATYKSAMDDISECVKASQSGGKRLFIKEMAFFIFPAPGNESHLASSFGSLPVEPRNPTLLPRSELAKFQFTFLIRHPYLSVPSYYRLSLPGEKEASQVANLTTNDLGYSELRRLFDYLREEGLIGRPSAANGTNGAHNGDSQQGICVVDAEELMEKPDQIMSAYCRKNGVPYNESLLHWSETEDQQRAASVIDRWGFSVTFHKAVLQSKGLGAQKNHEDYEKIYQKWVEEFGVEGANEIKEAADSQLDDYKYLKRFASV